MRCTFKPLRKIDPSFYNKKINVRIIQQNSFFKNIADLFRCILKQLSIILTETDNNIKRFCNTNYKIKTDNVKVILSTGQHTLDK